MNAVAKKFGKKLPGLHSADLPRSAFFVPRASTLAKTHLPLVQPNKDQLTRILASFELFCELPFSLIADIAAVSTVRVYHVGEFIWQREENVREIVLLVSGFAKLSRRDLAGASKTYGLYGPGDAIGLFAMCANMTHYLDAIALNEGLRTIGIDAQAFMEFTNRSVTLANNLRDQITSFAGSLVNKIEILSAGTISHRLAVLMTQLVERYGVDRRPNLARIPFSLTLEQIGEIVDARIETVARVLSQWKRAGWLTTDSRGFIFSSLDALGEFLPG
jgi:CRP/FNR family transcriptional regulator, nitrogen oxide reductase regulator